MATRSVPSPENLTIARPEATTADLWNGAPLSLGSFGISVEDAVNGLSGVLEVLDRDERNAQSAADSDVEYDRLPVALRDHLRTAARALVFSAQRDIERLREAAIRREGVERQLARVSGPTAN